MYNEKSITVKELLDKAHMEIIRLKYRHSATDRHTKLFREFAAYCDENKIINYDNNTGVSYFKHCFDIDISSDLNQRFSIQQRETLRSLRLLDDIYQFGYARRNSHHDYRPRSEYSEILDGYIDYCAKNNDSAGTIRVKRTKVCQFLCFVEGKKLPLSEITSSDLSEYITTLAGYKRPTLHICTSVLSCFLRYLNEIGIIADDMTSSIPKPKIYAEESVPPTWTADEVRRLLAVIDRTNAIGKRDYAMILIAVMLGMRAGDICALKFSDFDWNRRLITYIQQKTNKSNTLPILPEIGEAVIDYLKNARLESDSDHVFIRHIYPYGEFQSSTALSESIKKYMSYAGIESKNRKAAHSLRHTLASSLLKDRTPLMTISNVLGHFNPETTAGYIKIDIPSLRSCSLSYGERTVE